MNTIPVFPLSGAVLLPRGELPLHIFEPRYREMIRDAASSHGRIGMVQPTEPEMGADNPRLFGTGCVGRVTALRETDDGCYDLTLVGLCRFDIVEELPMVHSYRQVLANYDQYLVDLKPGESLDLCRDQILEALKGYLEVRQLEADWSQVQEVKDETLINALSMICPFEVSEKQALLESPDLAARAELLVAILEMASHSEHDEQGAKH